MRLAEIVNGIVANVIEADPGNIPDWAAGFVDIGADGGPGWLWDGTTATPPPDNSLAEARAAMQLSKRQVRLGLLAQGLITEAEAVAWATSGALPAAIEAMVLALPTDAQAAARITLADFTVAYRTDPMVALLAAAVTPPLDDTALDQFFTACAAL